MFAVPVWLGSQASGRLGVGGPMLGGILAAKYADNLNMVFYILGAIAWSGGADHHHAEAEG